ELERLDDRDEILHIDLAGRDPDEGATRLPYEKGRLFLHALEVAFGRKAFDEFLRGYFDHFAFQSIVTDDFLRYLRENLLDSGVAASQAIPLEEWVRRPGLPAAAPRPISEALRSVAEQAESWISGALATAAVPFA